MNTIARWLETFGALLANAGSLVVAQVRNFLVVSFWVLICLAICVGVGLIFQLQPLVVVPVLVIASKDDPISDVHHYDQVKWPKRAEFLMSEQGGHIGFINRKHFSNGSLRWSQFKSVEFVKKYGAIVRA